jgi:transcriptional regulator with XRE-family HTH domain
MSAFSLATDAGKRLKAVRERLRLSIREVERLSAELAAKTNASDYYISHTWLGEIEAGRLKPNIYRLKTLSLIYKRDLDELLSYFGISIRSAGVEHELVGLPHTQLLMPELKLERGTLIAPVSLRDKVDLENTNLVSRMFERWAEIPVELLQKIGWSNSLYGYIGIRDYTLYPILRPGSFVQIDSQQTKIQREGWRDEFERPIYFVELRDRYIASWCEISGNQLVLLPSPHSGQQASHVRFPGDADIVGRVTAVTMRIAEPQLDARS